MKEGLCPDMPVMVNDVLSSGSIACLSYDAVGPLFLLLFHAWNDPDCTLPDDDEQLAALSRAGKDWKKIGPKVRKFFVVDTARPGRIYNVKSRSVRLKQEERVQKAKKKARLAAQGRWGQPDLLTSDESIPADASGNASSIPQASSKDMLGDASSTRLHVTHLNGGESGIRITPVAMTQSPPSQSSVGKGSKGESGGGGTQGQAQASPGPFRPRPGQDRQLAEGLFAKTAQQKQAAAEATIERIKKDPRNWVVGLKPEAQALLDDWAQKKPEGYSLKAARLQADKSNYTHRLCDEAMGAVNEWRSRIGVIQLAVNGRVAV